MNMVKKAGSILLSVLLWGVILVAALYTVVTLATRDEANVSSIAGFSPLVVKTDSMSPTFNADDLILIHTTDPAALQVGDIVTFHTIINNEYALNTHRIADIFENNGVRSYTTKGDNNDLVDGGQVSRGTIIAVYTGTKIPALGKVLDFLSTKVGFGVCILLPLILFFIYQLVKFVMAFMSVKNSGKKVISAADEELIRQKAVEEYLKKQQEKDTTNEEIKS